VPDAAGNCVSSYNGRQSCGPNDSSGIAVDGGYIYMVPDASGECVPLPACVNSGGCTCPAGLYPDATGICVRARPPSGTGGSGLSSAPPNTCIDPGSEFTLTTYSTAPELCAFVQEKYRYYQGSECGNPGRTLVIDDTLNAQAQAAAEDVAAGGAPAGAYSGCCASSVGPSNDFGEDSEYFYVTNADTNGPTARSAYTSPDSDWFTSWDTGLVKACGFIAANTDARADFYHYCFAQNDQPAKVGCGVAVDTNGISWRVVQLSP